MVQCTISSSYDKPDKAVMGHDVCVGKSRIRVVFLFNLFRSGVNVSGVCYAYPSLKGQDVEILYRLWQEIEDELQVNE